MDLQGLNVSCCIAFRVNKMVINILMTQVFAIFDNLIFRKILSCFKFLGVYEPVKLSKA